VQPVLDRNCVKCHDGSGAKEKAFDLRDRRRVPVCPNYSDLGQGARVSTSYVSLTPYVSYPKPTGYGGGVLPLKPMEYGSKASPLILLLAKGHGDVKLPNADWQALAAWIDCNAPFLSDFNKVDEVYNFGRVTPVELALIRERIEELARELGPDGGRVVAYHAAGLRTGSGQPGQDQGVVVTPSWYFGTCWPDMLRIPELRPTQKILGWNEGGIEFRVRGLDPAKRYSLCWTWWGYDNVGVEQSAQSYNESHKDKVVTLIEKAHPPVWLGKKETPIRVTMALPAEQVQEGKGSVVILLSKQAGPRCVFSEIWFVEHEAGKVVTALRPARN